MKTLSNFVPLGILAATAVSSFPLTERDVNEALIPQFGFSSGVNPTGTGDCDGAVKGSNGQPIKVPCDCPPDRATFVNTLNANVAAGHVLNNPSVLLSFPEDNSKASQLARLNAASDTLQNLNGPGKGCPIVSTTFQAQAAAINAGTQPAPSASPSVPSPSQTHTVNDTGTQPAPSANPSVPSPSQTHTVNDTGTQPAPSANPSVPSSSQTHTAKHALKKVHQKNVSGTQPAALARPSVPSSSQTPKINNDTRPASSASPSAPSSSQAPTTNKNSTPTAPSATPSSTSVTPAQIEALAPQLGFTSGKNPTGTGNCDGAINGADGKPILVPCDCPPDQATFNQHLVGDVLAGHAVNNPSVKVSFPLDNSVGSQLARVDTALVTLQNLNGSGKGCPAVSTTLSTQQAALLKQL